MRARAMPRVGDAVTVVYLAARVSGAIEHLEDGGRRLNVVTEEGESITFTLSRATGRFVAAEGQSAQLLFSDAESD